MTAGLFIARIRHPAIPSVAQARHAAWPRQDCHFASSQYKALIGHSVEQVEAGSSLLTGCDQAPQLPLDWTAWTFLQYSQGGPVAGVAGQVDLDRFNGDRDRFQT
jgi:hypothetical protein